MLMLRMSDHGIEVMRLPLESCPWRQYSLIKNTLLLLGLEVLMNDLWRVDLAFDLPRAGLCNFRESILNGWYTSKTPRSSQVTRSSLITCFRAKR
jgi:hypothetical protein